MRLGGKSKKSKNPHMLVQPEIFHPKVALTNAIVESSTAPFDGVVAFNFDPVTSQSSFSYVSENLAKMLKYGSSQELNLIEVEAIFDTEENEETLTQIFSQLISSDHPDQISLTHRLRSSKGTNILTVATFTMLPIDLNKNDLDKIVILGMFRDLSKNSAEKLLADSVSVTNSLSMGHDLGKLCYQVCRQLEDSLGEGFSCILGVSSPAGPIAPVMLGGQPYELVGEILEFSQKFCDGSEIKRVEVDQLPIDFVGPLQKLGANSLWFVPISDMGLSKGEPLHNGYLYDFGRILKDFKMDGLLVIEAPSSAELDVVNKEIIEYSQTLLSTAISHATKMTYDSFEKFHDILTQLPNREFVLDQLQQILDGCDPQRSNVCVLLVDIDKFQAINQSLGRDSGDRILQEIADRLLASVRLGDSVGRISSDQYLMICAADKGELNPDGVASRILKSVDKPIVMPDKSEIFVTASIGMVVVEDMQTQPVELLGQAESALKVASTIGRGEYAIFDETHQQYANELLEIESSLRKAISDDEFRIHYQPIIDLSSGKMVGAEALVRWERPEVGLVSPGDFIPVAEESGLIVPLGTWIIDKVCEDLGNWEVDETGLPLISVNLSAKQLESDLLIPGLISALRRNDLHPSKLGFEITESMEINKTDSALIALSKLCELNCTISIDDFGIGHATMEYLRRFSMAKALKIDRSFVSGLGNSIEDSAIVSASMALAKALSMEVVAEGVETVEQAKILKDLGCSYAQGFGYSKPVDLDSVKKLWKQKTLEITT